MTKFQFAVCTHSVFWSLVPQNWIRGLDVKAIGSLHDIQMASVGGWAHTRHRLSSQRLTQLWNVWWLGWLEAHCVEKNTMQINLSVAHIQHARTGAHVHPIILLETQKEMQRVFLCVYSQFAHLVFSCRAAIVLLALTRLINFLFLRVDARVTFPAGAHTLMLSTASHPGYKNKGSSLGGSCMEKKSPRLSSLTPLCT